MGLEGFWLFSGGVTSVIEGVCVFFSGDYRCARVFKLLVHLGVRARSAVLPRVCIVVISYYQRDLLALMRRLSMRYSWSFCLGYREILREDSRCKQKM